LSLMDIKLFSILILCILATIDDVKNYKVRNGYTITFAIAGVVVNLCYYNFEGLKSAIFGWLIPVSCLFPLYVLQMLGAGDIKLIGAIGAIMGYSFAFNVIAYSFFAGALIALTIITVTKNAKVRIKYFLTYLKNSFLTMRLAKYDSIQEKNNGYFRFAYSVLIAVIIQIALL
jgi:prepilin peptidase CpaA